MLRSNSSLKAMPSHQSRVSGAINRVPCASQLLTLRPSLSCERTASRHCCGTFLRQRTSFSKWPSVVLRNTRTTAFVQLNAHLCRACWQCINTCHKGVLGKVDFLGHRHARIAHPDQCAGCLKCVRTCSSGAFTAIPNCFNNPEKRDRVLNEFNRDQLDDVGLVGARQGMKVLQEMNELGEAQEKIIREAVPKISMF